MLQELGGTGIKIGQQLGLRADIIPIEYCDELIKLLDQVPPFPSSVAVEIIEREIGRSLASIFRAFDPEVIGSGSIGCVYLAELVDGRKVAVKVRRPGIEVEMRSDLRVLETLGRIAEALNLVAPGGTRFVLRELARMLIDEVDYGLEAQQTEVFGREAAKHGVVSAPAVVVELCRRNVIVTEFVDGIFLHEILHALEDEDSRTLDHLRAQGYDTLLISRQIVRMMFWQMFESSIFHADPHPANIVVKPDNSLVLIDFGACGSLSRSARRAVQAIFRNVNDPHGMARAIIGTQQPLPYIDVEQYAQELYYLVRDQTLAMRSKSGKWYERSSGALLAKAAEIGREYKARLNPELLRYMRTSFLGDAILVRLCPDLDIGAEFGACYEEYLRRRRSQKSEALRQNWRLLLYEMMNRVGEVTDLVGLELERRRQVLETPQYRYAVRIEKSAFVLLAFVRATIATGLWLLVWVVSRHAATVWGDGNAVSWGDAVAWTVVHPAFVGGLGCYVLLALWKVARRLEEPNVVGRAL